MVELADLDHDLCLSVTDNAAMLKPQFKRGYRTKLISCLNSHISETQLLQRTLIHKTSKRKHSDKSDPNAQKYERTVSTSAACHSYITSFFP